MLTYSVAIRTLGKSVETLKIELESLHSQTVKPEKIIIYLARGYQKPDLEVGIEQYVFVDKGMLTQRALPYDEISSDCLLLLDDDVAFENDAIEKVLILMESNNADCIAFDTFQCHKMSLKSKIRAGISNLVFPRFNKKWAFKIHSNCSFSYINNPGHECYPSMSAAGPASLWKKRTFTNLHVEHERWIDNLDFAYGEDAVTFYKLYLNGGKLMVAFDSGVLNLDAKTSSGQFHENVKRYKTISKANIIRWHRTQYLPENLKYKAILKSIPFWFKLTWQLGVLVTLAISTRYRKAPGSFLKGISEGLNYIKSPEYKNIPPYIIK